jgi:hypothetical protein
MRVLITLLMILSLVSCNQANKNRDSRIEKFEKSFGVKELEYLNEIIDNLDNYLIQNYPDQKSKFRAYLADINENKVKYYWKIDSIKLNKYRESNLFRKYEKIYPDTVWFQEKTFCIKYPDVEFIEEIIPIRKKKVDLNIDSMINALKQEPKLLLIEQSDFEKALKSIQKPDSLITSYQEVKNVAGDLSPSILASGLMYYMTEYNEYFAKRIFVMDLYDY